MTHPLMSEFNETVWFDKWKYEEAERKHAETLPRTKVIRFSESDSHQVDTTISSKNGVSSNILKEIAAARELINNSLSVDAPNAQTEILNRMQTLEKETKQLRTITDELHQTIQVMAKEMKVLVLAVTKTMDGANTKDNKYSFPADYYQIVEMSEVDTVKNDTADESDDDSNLSDDEDLFGSSDDEDHEEKERIKQERLAAYKAKKEKKPALIAKSNVILDVKPWDDETDMNEVTKLVKEIQMDGLVWGASKLVPLAYGIKKLQISCVVEDDKVSIDELQEKICENEDHVQSVDIAAFNKV